MCEPMTAVTLAVTAISTAVGMFAQHQQGKQQQSAMNAQAEYNAQAAANEQATREQLAQNEVAKGIAEENRMARAFARQQGEMESMFGASGFSFDSGSMLNILAESAEEGQSDLNISRHNTAMAAWQHQVGATAAANDQQMALYQKKQAKSGQAATWIGMGGSLLSGIGTGLGQWNSYQNTQSKG